MVDLRVMFNQYSKYFFASMAFGCAARTRRLIAVNVNTIVNQLLTTKPLWACLMVKIKYDGTSS
jgi:hypothetical protein